MTGIDSLPQCLPPPCGQGEKHFEIKKALPPYVSSKNLNAIKGPVMQCVLNKGIAGLSVKLIWPRVMVSLLTQELTYTIPIPYIIL